MKTPQKTGPSRRPQRVRNGVWYYEDATSIGVYASRVNTTTNFIGGIPWARLMKSADRCGTWDAKQQIWTPSAPEGK